MYKLNSVLSALGLVFALLVNPPVFAKTSPTPDFKQPWNLSAQQLLQAIQGRMENAPLGQTNTHRQVFADGYILSVIDSQSWCFTGNVLPHELKAYVFEYLTALDASRLSENAALLIHEAFTQYCSKQKNE